MLKVLLIEDEESLNQVVTFNLELEGHQVEQVFSGSAGLQFLNKLNQYDLIILDLMLPGISGWELCQKFRENSNTPILIISAKGSSSDKVKGLKLGADDYLAKPFDLEELLLRVKILCGRKMMSGHSNLILKIGNKEVNKSSFEVLKNGQLFSTLSKREIDLLLLFNEHVGEVLSRDFILDNVWGVDQFPTSRTIDNYILQFRKLFEPDPKNPKFFHSIRGVGYKFTSENAD